MAFSSLIFLFFYLPCVLLGYYLVPRGMRNGFLLFVSVAFYLWGAPKFFLILLSAAVIDYSISRRIHESQDERVRKLWLVAGLTMNVTLLAYFKYSNFFVAEANSLLSVFGMTAIPWTQVVLPIGISFITFEEISYLVDIYRRVTPPAPNFPTYALFLCLFPHLIAGPIFRYHDVSEQLLRREHSQKLFLEGMIRFCVGLGKKVLIADPVASIANLVFSLDPKTLDPAYAWLGVLSYTIQIYFDFSGYSDMAIGLGRMFGFRFVENFNRPYTANSITDFWKRWHISLSNWMREYLYIPLGGNRLGPIRTYFNLWVVFLISGFWHGANWTFLCWGCFHGVFLVLERAFLLTWLSRLPVAVQRLWTFFLICLSWVLFRADSLPAAFSLWKALFGLSSGKNDYLLADVASNRALCMLIFGILLGVLLRESFRTRISLERFRGVAMGGIAALVVFFLSTLALVNSAFHPFIYFRF